MSAGDAAEAARAKARAGRRISLYATLGLVCFHGVLAAWMGWLALQAKGPSWPLVIVPIPFLGLAQALDDARFWRGVTRGETPSAASIWTTLSVFFCLSGIGLQVALIPGLLGIQIALVTLMFGGWAWLRLRKRRELLAMGGTTAP